MEIDSSLKEFSAEELKSKKLNDIQAQIALVEQRLSKLNPDMTGAGIQNLHSEVPLH